MAEQPTTTSHEPVDEVAHVFDQTNGVLDEGGEPSRPRRRQASPTGDVPVATNMLFGGQ
jgi:hypothetical protein